MNIFLAKIAQFLLLLHVSTLPGGIMCLLAIKFPIRIRNIIVTLQKLATITFLDTGCLVSIFYCFLFGKKSMYFRFISTVS